MELTNKLGFKQQSYGPWLYKERCEIVHIEVVGIQIYKWRCDLSQPKWWYTLWLCQNSCWKWPFIVDFPIKNGDFHSYVSSPEGIYIYILVKQPENQPEICMNKWIAKKQCSDPKVILKSDMEVTTSTIPISSLTQVPSHHPTVFVSCKVSEYLRSSDITPGSQSTKRTREHIAIWTTFVHTYLHAYIIIYYIIIYIYMCLANAWTVILVYMYAWSYVLDLLFFVAPACSYAQEPPPVLL